MFAVMKTGGKQYKVAKDDVFAVEKLEANAGDTVQFNEILMVGGDDVSVGAPFVDGAAVQAEVLEQFRGEKTISFKKRRRKHSSQRKKGHRQSLTRIKVVDILASGAKADGAMSVISAAAVSAAAVAAAAPEKAPEAAKAKPAPKKAEAKPAPEATEAEAAAQVEEAAPAADATEPANLLTEAKGEADDLKRISGVGPKLEEKLNSIGVYHFWQIAEWGPAEIAFMDDRLSFKGRIDRDDWIGQAKAFAAEAGE